jgi:hypothetical protein
MKALLAVARRYEGIKAYHQGQFSTGLFQQALPEKSFNRMA